MDKTKINTFSVENIKYIIKYTFNKKKKKT